MILGTAHIDGLFVRLDDVFHNRQTQPGTASIAGATFIGPVKAVEQVIEVFRLYADAVIADFYQDKGFHIIKTDLGQAAFFSVLDGIVHQVHHHLPDIFLVGPDIVMLVRAIFKNQAHLAFFGPHFKIGKHLFRQVMEAGASQIDSYWACFQFIDGFEIFDDRLQAISIFGGPVQELHIDFRVIEGAVEQGMDKTLDVKNRRFQFM